MNMKKMLACLIASLILVQCVPLQGLAAEAYREEQPAAAEQPAASEETEETGEDSVPEAEEPETLAATVVVSGEYSYTVNSDGTTATITDYTGEDTVLAVPGTIDGYTVTGIGSRAFEGCSGLAEITIPGTVTSIGSYAFGGCTGLTEFIIPDSVTYIGHHALDGCTGITSIIIPNTLTTYGEKHSIHYDSAFAGSSIETVVIEEGATAIPQYAFRGCTSLKRISIPDSVTTIDVSAFYGCTALTEITIPDSVTTIGASAFEGCSGLTEITIPESVTTIGSYAFKGCTGLAEFIIPDSVTTINNNAFNGCTGLTKVYLPASLTSIGEGVFYGCTGLATAGPTGGDYNIEFSWTTSLPKYAFEGCNSLSAVYLPETVTAIGVGAFEDCPALVKVNLPETVATLDAYAFLRCTSLTEITLPSQITQINNDTFRGCTGLTAVNLPTSLTSIGSKAFNGCTALTEITIPDSVTTINNNAFTDCTGLTAYIGNNLPAVLYMIDHSIPYNLIYQKLPPFPTTVLDRAVSYYTTASSSASVSGLLTYICEYTIDDEIFAATGNQKLVIRIPAQAVLDNSTLKLNGTLVTNFTNKDNLITVPVTEQSGVLRFSVALEEYISASSYALLQYRYNGSTTSEIIGIADMQTEIITLQADDITSETELPVSGITAPESAVEIYVNDEYAASAVSNKSGRYSAEVELTDPYDMKRYTIRAYLLPEVQTYSRTQGPVSNIFTDIYTYFNPETPVLTEFALYYDGHGAKKMDLLDATSGAVVSFNPNYPYTFQAVFSNSDAIEKVYIVSERNNDIKKMEAIYDAELDCWLATGHFDPNNPNYVPGNLGIEWVEEEETLTFSSKVDSVFVDYPDLIPDAWQNANVENIVNTEDMFEATFTLNDSYETSIRMMVDSKVIDAFTTAADLIEMGAYYHVDENGTEKYVVYTETFDKIEMKMYDFVADEVITSVVEYVDFTGLAPEFAGKVKIATFLNDLVTKGPESMFEDTAMGKVTKGIKNNHELLNYANTILHSDLSPADKKEAVDKAYTAATFNVMAITYTIAQSAAVMAGVANPVVAATVVTAAVMTLVFLDGASNHVKFDPLGFLLPSLFNLRWKIDPSGYVYEGVTSNRLEGVKTTAYYQDPDTGNAVLWDAAEFDQENPLYTNSEGKYAWDVPEGLWQVKYEKDGYETTYSEWLPVPPPQTEVNIGMVSLEAPVVEYCHIYPEHAEIVFSKYMVPFAADDIQVADTAGNPVAFTLEYDATQTDLAGNVFAKEYVLRFADSLMVGEAYTVSIAPLQDYAGCVFGAKIFDLVCESEISVQIVSEAVFPYGTVQTIPLIIMGGSDMELTAVSSAEHFVSVVEISEEGLVVAAQIPGEAVIEIRAEGYPVLAVVRISSAIGNTAGAVMGDVNGDGMVNAADVELLNRYFAGYDVDMIYANAAGMDDDGILTRKDAMILARYVAGWNGYTLPYLRNKS